MEKNNKIGICQSCNKTFNIDDLNKIRFRDTTILLCDFCIKYTDFIELKCKHNNTIDITFEDPE